jgi:uncharacterized membrane protein
MKRADNALDRIEGEQRLDRVVDAAVPIADRLDRSAGSMLSGEWLGHPLHPALTDLPIGFWTSSFVLDLVGGRRSRDASQRLIGLGILSVIPTAAAGLVDWKQIKDQRDRRVGVVHALSNTTATALYVMSWRARRRDRHVVGVLLGFLGAGAATIGGYLGGHLAFPPADTEDTEMTATEMTASVQGDPVRGGPARSAAPTPEDHSLNGLIGG